MSRPLAEDLGRLALRLPGLALALFHGWGKVTALASGQDRFVEAVAGLGFPAPAVFAWAAALSECLGGILVAVGLGARIAAAFAGFTMVVAAFGRHHAHEHLAVALGLRHVPEETLKAWGNPELALVYLACFLGVLLLGPGRLSADAIVRGGRRK